MSFNVIFVSGVHGVGKSTVCERMSQQFILPHYSASTLIKDVKNGKVDKNKIVIDASKNQDYLLSALNELTVNTNAIILDGHFCLQGKKEIIDIPLETFKGMGVSAVILLIDTPENICARMHQRDNHSFETSTINALQKREKERAKFVAEKIEVPLLEMDFNDYSGMSEWLLPILKKICI